MGFKLSVVILRAFSGIPNFALEVLERGAEKVSEHVADIKPMNEENG